MIRLIYVIEKDQLAAELDWLNDQKIYPAHEEFWDWGKEKTRVRIGAIIPDSSATLIKLRHNLQMQDEYRQR